MERQNEDEYKQLLDNLKEKRIYWNLKEKTPDGTLWIYRCGGGYAPDIRQTTL